MTERGRQQVSVACDHFAIGPSALHWDGESLTITIDEIGMPFPRRVRGTVRLRPQAVTNHIVRLNPEGNHTWWPIAPVSTVEVDLQKPGLRWSGPGYLDMNRGDVPIADGFRDWHWSRAPFQDGAAVLYHGMRRNGSRFDFGWRFDRSGIAMPLDPPPPARLPRTGWRIHRETRSDADHPAGVIETLEDTPFYARSVVRSTLEGQSVTAMHESLSLDRLVNPVVQAMLPFRMPRRP
jgi:carotenoid 1,2-hydratase